MSMALSNNIHEVPACIVADVMAKAPHKNKRYPIYIWEWRKKVGLTSTQLADRAGYDQGTISAIENGSRRANLDHLFAIATALGIGITQLFRSPEDPLSGLEERVEALSEANQFQALRVLDAFIDQ